MPNNDLSTVEKLCLWYVNLGRTTNYRHTSQYIPTSDPLRPLRNRFRNFDTLIKNKSVIDFGCAKGNHSFALANAGANDVLGVEILQDRLDAANEMNEQFQLKDKISFKQRLEEDDRDKYDVAISLNSFEHFSDPLDILQEIFLALKAGGRLLMSFGPPWYSAYGPHQLEFTRVPWPHLLFGESTVMKIRGRIMDQPEKTTYADRWLNQMTIGIFEKTISESRFDMESVKYNCSKVMNIFSKVPGVRELFIINVTCILTKPT